MNKLSKLSVAILTLVVALILGTISFYFYKSETEVIRKENYAYLEAIANLKIDQITKWRSERLSEAQYFPSVGKLIKSTVYLTNNINEKEAKEFLEQTFRPIQLRHGYENIFVTDLQHKILFSLDEDFKVSDSVTIENSNYAIKKDSILFLDFYDCETHSEIHLDIISPIKDNNGKPIGVLILRINPSDYLFPIIQKWPTPSKTAESLIIRKEGNYVRLLSEGKYKKNSAMTIVRPIQENELVGVKGVLGNTGIIEGLDYRGVKVLASIKKISGTNWSLISKVDQDEIYQELFYRGSTIAIVSFITFLLIGAFTMYLYKLKQSIVYKNLFLKEKELSETREEYKTALYSIGDAVITTDNNGRIKQMNMVAEELTGWKESEASGKKLEEVFKIISEETKQIVQSPVNRVLSEGTIIGLANHTLLITKAGNQIPISDSGSPIRDDDNNIIGVILVFRDQTEEREKEKILFESNEKFSKIFEHSSDSISLTQLSTGRLYELNEGFEKMFGYTRDEVIGKSTFELGLWADPKDREEVIKSLKEYGHVKNYEAVGVRKDGNKITAIISGEKIIINHQEYLLLTLKDITERKKLEDILKASEEKYRMLLEFASDAFFQGDKNGNFITVNNQAVELTGYTRDELLKMNMRDVFSDDTLSKNPLRYDRLENGEAIKNERVIITKDKKELYVEMTSKQMPDGTYQSFFRDITDRKKAEKELKASEDRFTKIFMISPDSININRLEDGMYISANHSFCKATGYTKEEIIGKLPAEMNFWNDYEDRNRFVTELKQNGSVDNLEAEFVMKDGSTKYCLISASIIMLDGVAHVINIIRDISERKKAEQELRESETYLKNSQRVALIGHYDFNFKTGTWNSSEMLDTIFGIEKTYPHDINGWSQLIYTDDRQMMIDHLLIDVAQNHQDFSKEYRIIRDNDKELRWMYGQGKIELDEKNNTARMFGVIQDITERKKGEEELIKTKTHYQKLIENAPDGIVQVTLDGKFKYVSPSAKRIFGHPLNERVTQSANELTHPDDLPFVLETLHKIIENPEFIPIIEYRFKHANNSYIWIESTFNNLLADPAVASIVINFRDITFRKQAEKDLFEKYKLEEQISKIAKTAPGGLWSFKIDVNGKLSLPYVSSAWCQIFGCRANDVVDNASLMFSKIHPDDIEHFNNTIQQSAITMDDWQTEFRIVHPEKGIIWVEGHSTPSIESDSCLLWHGFVTDITVRKLAEEKLRTLSRAVEQSPAIIVITDTHGNIEFVNPKFTDITGYSLNEVLGRNPKILKSGNTTNEEYKNLWKTITNKMEWRGEFLNKKKNGELYWESAYISPILNDSGKILNFIAVKEDITEHKKLIADLIEAKEKAEEMNRVKGYFFANMSHELRTPFVGIVGFSELLANSLKDPDEREMAQQILKSSKRLTDTLNKILDVTRLEFDKIDLRMSELNVVELVEQLKTLFSKSAASKNLEIKTKYLKDDLYIKTDGRLLEEILSNLVNNAVKYTNKGFIEIEADLKSVEDKSALILKVKDTGVGIPKDKQEIIWQEFRQVSEGISRSFEGTGLGLTIIRKYVDTLNGSVYLDSEVDIGSTFTIIIPVEKVMPSKSIKKKTDTVKPDNTVNASLDRKPKILYVEDDSIALSFIDKVLRANYEVDTAFSANIALELVEKKKYEAIMLDINLGKGMDGVELMKLIRKMDSNDKIPIVAVTAYAAESDRLEFLSKGFTHYLSKPFTSAELRGLLSKIFS